MRRAAERMRPSSVNWDTTTDEHSWTAWADTTPCCTLYASCHVVRVCCMSGRCRRRSDRQIHCSPHAARCPPHPTAAEPARLGDGKARTDTRAHARARQCGPIERAYGALSTCIEWGMAPTSFPPLARTDRSRYVTDASVTSSHPARRLPLGPPRLRLRSHLGAAPKMQPIHQTLNPKP